MVPGERVQADLRDFRNGGFADVRLAPVDRRIWLHRELQKVRFRDRIVTSLGEPRIPAASQFTSPALLGVWPRAGSLKDALEKAFAGREFVKHPPVVVDAVEAEVRERTTRRSGCVPAHHSLLSDD